MKTSLILPAYNLTEELESLCRRFIESIYYTEGEGELEFIVIDNGSPFGGSMMQEQSTIYIRNYKNQGYCKAVNQGMKLATGDLIVVANNDIRVSPNWLVVAKEILESDSKIGSVHFKMVDYEAPFNLGEDIWIGGKERWCHSSFYVIRPEAIPKGQYWEGYTAGGYDDWDIWLRFRKNGWKQAYTNKAAFQHEDSSTYLAMDKIEGGRAERDKRNRELFKERHSDYPETLFEKEFPEQMKLPYRPFP